MSYLGHAGGTAHLSRGVVTAPVALPVLDRADYGIDAPGVVRAMALLAITLLGGGLVLSATAGPVMARLGTTLLWPGASFFVTAMLMLASSRFGKLRARDRLLARLGLLGAETVLDVGCGHGLLLVGAARRLPYGQAIGVDLWSQVDQYANSAEATCANAMAEGVLERVLVQHGDMRKLPLPDASVDAVVSSLAIHNLSSASERARAIQEIIRVLRPGGRLGIIDIAYVRDYARDLTRAGWTIEHRGLTPWIFPPAMVLVAKKPL